MFVGATRCVARVAAATARQITTQRGSVFLWPGSDRRGRRTASPLRWTVVVLGLLLTSPQIALAHDGVPPTPHDLWRSWYWQPTIVLGLLVAAWVYARGTG